ncbi:hypothetical protein TNCV_3926311 [Trichonephila clavipes]|nr:hypothetical protein TNCV_3926311 [Trichonephila clavipes]
MLFAQVDLVDESEMSSRPQVDLVKGSVMLSAQVMDLEYSQVEGWTRPWKVKSILQELGEHPFGDNVHTKHCLLHRQQDVTGSSRDRIRRVRFQHHSMIEHLVKRFKAPPKQIGIGPTPETGRGQFINQHGHVGRLNQVNLARLYRSTAKRKVFFHKNMLLYMYTILLSVFFKSRSGFLNIPLEIFSHKTSSGLNSFTCLASKMARLKLSNNVFFLMPIVFAKQDKHPFGIGLLVKDARPDVSLPSGIYQSVGFSRAASRASRSWKCARERHQFDPSCTKAKRRLIQSVETRLLLYVPTGCGWSHP